MKSKRHKPEQIIAKLREADAILGADKTIAQVVQQLAVSEQTYHRWRNEYNHRRPHSALGYVPPAMFAATLADSLRPRQRRITP